jgi:hypothetical protein
MLRKIMVIPYKDLYIYEVSGELLGSRGHFKEDFVGCWNEGDVPLLGLDKDILHSLVYTFISRRIQPRSLP